MASGIYAHPIRRTLLLAFAANVDHFRPIEILIADREEVRQIILRYPVARITGAVRDHAGDLAGGPAQRHGARHTSSARESACVRTTLIDPKPSVRVLPNCIHSLPLLVRKVAGV